MSLSLVCTTIACGSSGAASGVDSGAPAHDGAAGTGPGSGSGSGTGSAGGSGTGSGSSTGSGTGTGLGSGTGSGSGTGTGTGTGSDGGATLFPSGTICNESGTPLTPPTTLKHVILIMEENENFGNVNGNAAAPYISSLATKCGYASNYLDNMFADNLESLPHYLAITSGSNCSTGLDMTGTGCITQDQTATVAQLSTESIFSQVTSWKAYEESMTTACDPSAAGLLTAYATKHNPPPYYSTLNSTCAATDIAIAALTCNANTTMTACTAPSNAFTTDLANDTLPQFAWVTPNLNNDMHNGTVTQGDNWLYTYMPLILQSPAYLNGEVAVLILWDEQSTASFGGTTPNLFVSPYITAGTVATPTYNHFAALKALESAFGVTTNLGCASGTAPGGGTCPTGSTADLRAGLNF